MKLIFRLIGLVVTVALISVIGLGVYGFLHRGELVEQAIVEATGNKELGGVANKIANGEELSDAELQKLLGVDTETFAEVKKSVEKLGIDANNGKELNEIITKNSDKLGDVQEVIGKVQAGELTPEQAVDQLAKTLDLP